MQQKAKLHTILNYCIAAVWLINGLYCKLFNFVPRHQLIVAKILGSQYAGLLTKAIGVSEICMAVWILSAYKPRLCAVVQIIIVLAMNVIEFYTARELLLFGKVNLIIAIGFVLIVGINEYIFNKKLL